MNRKRFEQQVKFILEVDKLKQIYRQSIITGANREENDAEHSWHLALMAMILAEYANEDGLDILKVIKMVLIHDIVEIDAGDTFIYDTEGFASKDKRERMAADRIFSLLPDDQRTQLYSLWEEFEARETPEAKFAAALDRFEPVLLNSQTKGHTWNKFDIDSSRVREKNAPVKEASTEIWQYINDLINDCIAQGILKK